MSASSEKTKQRLIDTTIRLVAEHGVKGVSVRTLTSEAGCKNLTAIHYHFGGKQQLVDAALRQVVSRVALVAAPGIAKLEARMMAEETLTMREVVTAWAMPVATLLAASPDGRQRARFIARVFMDAPAEPTSGLVNTMAPLFEKMMTMLQYVVPGVPREVFAMRIFAFTNNVIYTMCDIETMEKSMVAFVSGVGPLDALHGFIEYHTAAFSAPAEDIPESLSQSVEIYLRAWGKIEGAMAQPVGEAAN